MELELIAIDLDQVSGSNSEHSFTIEITRKGERKRQEKLILSKGEYDYIAKQVKKTITAKQIQFPHVIEIPQEFTKESESIILLKQSIDSKVKDLKINLAEYSHIVKQYDNIVEEIKLKSLKQLQKLEDTLLNNNTNKTNRYVNKKQKTYTNRQFKKKRQEQLSNARQKQNMIKQYQTDIENTEQVTSETLCSKQIQKVNKKRKHFDDQLHDFNDSDSNNDSQCNYSAGEEDKDEQDLQQTCSKKLRYYDEEGIARDKDINPLQHSILSTNKKNQNAEQNKFLKGCYRLISIDNLLQFLQQIADHYSQANKIQLRSSEKIYSCDPSKLICQYEYQNQQQCYFQCTSCNYVFTLQYSSKVRGNFDINIRQVLGTLLAGKGYTDLITIMGTLNCQVVKKDTFELIEKKIGRQIQQFAAFNMDEEAERSKDQAIQNNILSNNGAPSITLVLDSGWSHRSYKYRYSAFQAALPFICLETKKIINIQISQKYCYICFKSILKKVDNEHECNKNYTGPSTGMEAELGFLGFKYLKEWFNLEPSNIVTDKDASLYNRLLTSFQWEINQWFCLNHLIKNSKKYLCLLKSESKKPDPKLFDYLTDFVIKKHMGYVRGAVKKLVQNPETRKDQLLIAAINQVPYHILDQHEKCNDILCSHEKINENDKMILNPASVTKIQNAFENIKRSVSKVMDITTNLAENFHSIRAKYDGGKFRNYVQGRSFFTRSYIAVLRYNIGHHWVIDFLENYYYGRNKIDFHTKNFFLDQQKLYKQKRQWKQKLGYQKRAFEQIKELSAKNKDRNYGNAPEQDFNIDQSIGFLINIIDFYNRTIVKSQQQIEYVKQNTIRQTDSPEWMKERMLHITASIAGQICKMRKQTKPDVFLSDHYCLENQLNRRINSQMNYGKIQEPIGRTRVIDWLKNHSLAEEQYTCVETGLWIHPKLQWLAASPDGLIYNKQNKLSYIFEQKWIAKEENRKKTILQILKSEKNFYLQCNKNKSLVLPKTHCYYYQCQIQMLVTGVKECIFGVFTEVDQKIFMIDLDQDFIKTNFNKLKEFYFLVILPEINQARIKSESKCIDFRDRKDNQNIKHILDNIDQL